MTVVVKWRRREHRPRPVHSSVRMEGAYNCNVRKLAQGGLAEAKHHWHADDVAERTCAFSLTTWFCGM